MNLCHFMFYKAYQTPIKPWSAWRPHALVHSATGGKRLPVLIFVPVLQGLSSPVLCPWGKLFPRCVLPKAILSRVLLEAIVVIVTGVLKVYCADSMGRYIILRQKQSSVTWRNYCLSWSASQFTVVSFQSTLLAYKSHYFALFDIKNGEKLKVKI